MLKEKLCGFLRWNVVQPLADLDNEIIFQQLFAQQCVNAGLRNDFYPVGAAACHSLMYLLFRLFADNRVESVVELGSGQSTLLIDRIKAEPTRHVCYEEDPQWHALLGAKLKNCDYRHSPLVEKISHGIRHDGYARLESTDFDVLLVDGPRGVDRYSRFDCVQLALANSRPDYLIVIDDADRPGETQTVRHLVDALRRRGDEVKLSYGRGRTAQALVSCGRFVHCAYYF
jgi:predicted O-methyltransferase YrrM